MAGVTEQQEPDVVAGEDSAEEQARVRAQQAAGQLMAPGDATLPARHRYAAAQVQVIKGTVAKKLTDIELAWFLEVAARYRLDPLLKEIFAAKFEGDSGPVTIFAGRDGLLKAARDTGRFVRMESHTVCEKDVFRKVVDTAASIEEDREVLTIHHETKGMGSAARGPIVGAYALVWTTSSPHPWYSEATWEEYGQRKQETNSKKDTLWTLDSSKGFPSAMMVKVPESYTLRKACGLTGLVGEDEIRQQLDEEPERPALSGSGATPTVEYPEDERGERLKALVGRANELVPGSWRDAKVAVELGVGDEAAIEALIGKVGRFIATRSPSDPLLMVAATAEDEPEAEEPLPHVEWDADAYRNVQLAVANIDERLEDPELTEQARVVVEGERAEGGRLLLAYEAVMPEAAEPVEEQVDGPTEL
jgi:hypothetical protein